MSGDITTGGGGHGWASLFAAVYNPFLFAGELAGMRRHRAALLARAAGDTLEIGSGTGLNVVHYPDEAQRLVLTEPDPSMRGHLVRAVRRRDRGAQILAAGAEDLPFADATFDTIVSTLVLCTVDDAEAALREFARVLRPDGQLLFIEHVRSDSAALARWQDRLVGPWQRFAEGCRCNRATLEVMDSGGFRVDAQPAAWRLMPRIVRPLVIGRATIGERPEGTRARADLRLDGNPTAEHDPDSEVVVLD